MKITFKTMAHIALGMTGLALSLGVYSQGSRQLIKPADSTSVTATAGPSIVIPTLPSDICTGSNSYCYNPNVAVPPSTSGGLGKRIGIFDLNDQFVDTERSRYYGFVNAPYCVVKANYVGSGGVGGTFTPWVGQNADGTNAYAYDSGATHSRPTVVQLMCYFSGPAGTFTMNWFKENDNNQVFEEQYYPSSAKQTVFDYVNVYRYLGGRDKNCFRMTSMDYQRYKQVEVSYHYHRKSNHLDSITGLLSAVEYDTVETNLNYVPQTLVDSDCPSGGV